jgi:hypothetical protein
VPLTTSDRQSLIGPAVIGAVFGVLFAAAIAAVHSEYGVHMEPLFPGVRSLVGEIFLTFASVAAAIFLIFGATPILLRKLMSRHPRGPAA